MYIYTCRLASSVAEFSDDYIKNEKRMRGTRSEILMINNYVHNETMDYTSSQYLKVDTRVILKVCVSVHSIEKKMLFIQL